MEGSEESWADSSDLILSDMHCSQFKIKICGGTNIIITF
jgi:hypothetical protein